MAELIEPSVELESNYRAYIRELGSEPRYPFPLDYDHSDFASLVQKLRDQSAGIGIPEGFVSSTTYWLVDDSEIVGVSNLRHELTEALMLHGGHIGYGVRPSAQGRGYGKELLKKTLAEALKLGIERAVITCDKDNIASSRVIVANGGVLDSEYPLKGHKGIIQRYFIENVSNAA